MTVRRVHRNDPARMKAAEHARLWNAIEGAVVDAFKCHPGYLTEAGQENAVRSVTKRVVGSIVSLAKEVRKDGDSGS